MFFAEIHGDFKISVFHQLVQLKRHNHVQHYRLIIL